MPVTKYDPLRDAVRDIKDAIAEAQRSGKHILLEVGGEWCSWCHTLDRYFEANPKLTEFRDRNFVTVKIKRKKRGRPGIGRGGDAQAAAALEEESARSRRRSYFGVTALVATPPPSDFTQIVAGLKLMTSRKDQCALLPRTGVVAMSGPGQLVPTAPSLWISTLVAKPIGVLTPSTRSSPVLKISWARVMVTVSVARAGGALTTWVITAEVLARKFALPP